VPRAGAGALLALALLAGGCATHRSSGLVDDLIHRGGSSGVGEATFDVPGVERRPAEPARSARRPVPLVPVPKSSAGETVEASDVALGVALRFLGRMPGVAAELAVAAEYRRLAIYDRALTHAESALRLDPKNGAVYDELARTWRDAGDPTVALPHASRAVYFEPSSAEAHNTLGTVFAALGQGALARQQFEWALRLSPDAEYARTNLCVLADREPGAPPPGVCSSTAVVQTASDLLRTGQSR
jgi:tetratricopeptide (TPR) repeat protein